jgi:hypothetical protein
MRENSGLWIALLVVGGLLLAGLAGVGAMLAVKARTAQRDRAEDRRLAEAEAARARAEADLAALKQKKAAPDAKTTEKAPEMPADPTAAEKWVNADFREYAAKLYKDYQGNVVAADNRYKGKTVGVVGEVQKVETLKGKPVVILKAGSSDLDLGLETVWCVCDDADRYKLGELADGHWVALVGRCTGKDAVAGIGLGGMVMLQGCNVVHVARSKEEMDKAFDKK